VSLTDFRKLLKDRLSGFGSVQMNMWDNFFQDFSKRIVSNASHKWSR